MAGYSLASGWLTVILFDKNYAPAAFLIMQGERLWLTPLLIPLIMPLFAFKREKSDPLVCSKFLILTGAIGFSWLIIQGFSMRYSGLEL